VRRGLLILALLSALGLGAPLVAAISGLDPDLVDASRARLPPSAAHWLGTDELGRDAFVRLCYGARVSIGLAAGAAIAAVLLGGALGLSSAYAGGPWDRLMMRLLEIAQSTPRLPVMMLLLGLGAAASRILGLGTVIVLFSWTTAARLARAEMLRLDQLDFIAAARLAGASPGWVLRRHVLPNAAGPLIALLPLEVGEVIAYESVLSYLGLGVPAPTPSFGAMLRNGLSYVPDSPALLIAPGLATALAISAFHLLGEGLRRRLDPRRREG
jgi:peptide/nickel transport system permease protein